MLFTKLPFRVRFSDISIIHLQTYGVKENVDPKIGVNETPQIIHYKIGVFHDYKPSILGGFLPPIFGNNTHMTFFKLFFNINFGHWWWNHSAKIYTNPTRLDDFHDGQIFATLVQTRFFNIAAVKYLMNNHAGSNESCPTKKGMNTNQLHLDTTMSNIHHVQTSSNIWRSNQSWGVSCTTNLGITTVETLPYLPFVEVVCYHNYLPNKVTRWLPW